MKVKRDDLPHPERTRNAVWNGRSIRLLAARNEVVAFQVVVQAGALAIDDLRASLPALQRRGGGEIRYQPPAADPTDYRNRPIQVFSQRYMRVDYEDARQRLLRALAGHERRTANQSITVVQNPSY